MDITDYDLFCRIEEDVSEMNVTLKQIRDLLKPQEVVVKEPVAGIPVTGN